MEPELAFWSKFAGAQAGKVYFFCAFVSTVYLFFFFFFDIERVLREHTPVELKFK